MEKIKQKLKEDDTFYTFTVFCSRSKQHITEQYNVFADGVVFSSGKIVIEVRYQFLAAIMEFDPMDLDVLLVKLQYYSHQGILWYREVKSKPTLRLFNIERTANNPTANLFGYGIMMEGVVFNSGKAVANFLQKEGKSSSVNKHDSFYLLKNTHCYDSTTFVNELAPGFRVPNNPDHDN